MTDEYIIAFCNKRIDQIKKDMEIGIETDVMAKATKNRRIGKIESFEEIIKLITEAKE